MLRRDALSGEVFFNRVAASLAEADVVFAGAAFVGVAFEYDFGLRVARRYLACSRMTASERLSMALLS